MAEGLTVGEACKTYEGMPEPAEVFLSIHEDPAFKMRYEKALETWAYANMDKLTEEANNTDKDFVMVKGVRVPNKEAVQRSKLRLDTRAKLIEWANPKRFKDRETNTQTLLLAGLDEGQALVKLSEILQAARKRLLAQSEAQVQEPIDVTPVNAVTEAAPEPVIFTKRPEPTAPAHTATLSGGSRGRGSVIYELPAESPDHEHPALD